MRVTLPSLTAAPLLLLAGLLVAPVCLSGCAKGPVFQGGVYETGAVRYRITVPGEGWERIDVEEGQVAFVFPSLGATLSSHAECNNTGAPLRALTTHVLIGMAERKVVSEAKETLAGREALRTRLTAQIDGVAQEFEIVVVKKDGCNFDFIYSAPPERFAARLQDFQRFVAGFDKLSGAR